MLAFTCLLGLSSAARAQPAGSSDPVAPWDEPLFSIESPLGAIDYLAGRGLRLGRTGLTVGGFTTLEADKEQHRPGQVELDSVNVLVLWEPLDFLRGFAEIEIGNLLSIDTGTGDVESDANVQIERLYGDLSRSDALNLRIGKFQTPVGIWNLVPAEPFTWTATNPVLVETAFDEHTTGAAFFGSTYPADHSLEYWLYGQAVDPLDTPSDEDPYDRSIGGRVRYGDLLGGWALGASLLASEMGGRWNVLGGVDGFASTDAVELQGEFAIVDGNVRDRTLWGLYVQGVYHLGHAWMPLRSLHLVGRYEHWDPLHSSVDVDLGNVGLAWIPWQFLIVKAGYQFCDEQTDEIRRGFYSSISVIF